MSKQTTSVLGGYGGAVGGGAVVLTHRPHVAGQTDWMLVPCTPCAQYDTSSAHDAATFFGRTQFAGAQKAGR